MTDTWAARYKRWQRVRLATLRAVTDVIVHSQDEQIVDVCRSALVHIYSVPFAATRYACDGRPAFRSRRAAHEAGHQRTFRCVRCRRRHPGRLPARYLEVQ